MSTSPGTTYQHGPRQYRGAIVSVVPARPPSVPLEQQEHGSSTRYIGTSDSRKEDEELTKLMSSSRSSA